MSLLYNADSMSSMSRRCQRRMLVALASGCMAALHLAASAAILESKTSTGLALSNVPGQRVNIVNMTVPAGQWAATAKGSIINWGASDYVRCMLTVNGAVVDGATTMTGEGSGQPAVAEIVAVAKLSLAAPANVGFECSHDRNVPGQYVDPGASLLVQSDAVPGPIGPQGPVGPTGPRGLQGIQGIQGIPGPAVKTSAMCVQPQMGTFPSSTFCSCSQRTVTTSASPCTVTSETGSCSASTTVLSGQVYTGACCVCAP